MAKFVVVSSNPNKTGGFVWKLTVTDVVAMFGVQKSVKRTYYIGGMPEAAVAGTVFEESMKKFDVTERPYDTQEKDEEGNDIIIMLKWLHAKLNVA